MRGPAGRIRRHHPIASLSHSFQQAVHPLRREGVRRSALFFAALYFVQGTIDLSTGLPYQPIQYLLKEDLSLSAAQAGFVWAMIGLGWTIKPVYGLVSDFLPLGGSRRKGYLVLMSALGLGSWLALAVAPTAYAPVLVLLMACSFTLAFADVMADALMVETGRPLGLTGSFQSIQWAAMGLALTLAHLGGGYLSEYATPHTAFFVCGFFPLATLLATLCFVREAPHQSGQAQVRETAHALRTAARSRPVWIVAGFLFVWNFSPLFGTPLLYYERDILQFSKIYIGTLGALTNAAGMIGAVIFFFFFRSVSLRRLLFIAVTLGVLSTLSFVGLTGPRSAIVIFLSYGLISQITHLAVLDLAARSCPARVEGTVFALMMSALNLGRSGSQVLGGWLYDQTGFVPLVFISAAFTALCWLMISLLRSEQPSSM